ncbi:hypothetical protein [Bradyrhizobium sp. HKCCYLS2038]|uniref:hypothetical protein n=1 Tax=Bradyrhizobium sp. HKCCYLS2038 TaxID=3420764 RepID=UPI003EBC88A7
MKRSETAQERIARKQAMRIEAREQSNCKRKMIAKACRVEYLASAIERWEARASIDDCMPIDPKQL